MDTDILILAGSGLFTLVGGGGLWLGILQTKVANNTKDIINLMDKINQHLENFNSMSTRVVHIETVCDGIYDRLKDHDLWERSIKYPDKDL